MDRPWLATFGVAVVLAAIHLRVSASNGLLLPDGLREAFGASAATVATRPWAQLTAPFFHYGVGHIAYNSLVFALGLPFAMRRLGVARALGLAFVASPLAGFLVNLGVILPLAAAGVGYAEAAAGTRLVGSSIVAFAALGMALASAAWASGPKPAAAVMTFGIYEAALESFGLTQPFVGAYHFTGFVLGILLGRAASRSIPEK